MSTGREAAVPEAAGGVGAGGRGATGAVRLLLSLAPYVELYLFLSCVYRALASEMGSMRRGRVCAGRPSPYGVHSLSFILHERPHTTARTSAGICVSTDKGKVPRETT